MSTLAADVTFDFTFPPCDPTTPPSFSFDPSLLEIPYNAGHSRSSSHASVYSFESSPSDSTVSTSTRRTTPERNPIRTHGPLLLPKIRKQDQAFGPTPSVSPPKRVKVSPEPSMNMSSGPHYGSMHSRSATNPENIFYSTSLLPEDSANTASLLCSPVNFAPVSDASAAHSRRASSCSVDNVTVEKYGFPTYRHMPAYMTVPSSTGSSSSRSSSSSSSSSNRASPPLQAQAQAQAHLAQPDAFLYPSYAPRAHSPLAASVSPEPTPTTTLLSYLTSPNPAPALVRTISFPLRDPHTKHFWWDVRQIRPWTGFTASTILSFPGAASLLSCPVPTPLLPSPGTAQRHPENEAVLHSIYSSYYLPKLNAALALSSQRPLQLSVPSKTGSGASGTSSSSSSSADCMFVANAMGEMASAAAIFGGKPTARVVGLVKSFDRFNTGMRAEGNVKRVEYLRGLAHLHHVMREHGCRYGFILTEIELVFVRNGSDAVPHFGYLEVGSVQLAATASADQLLSSASSAAAAAAGTAGGAGDSCPGATPLTACLALWGLCMLAGDEPMAGHAHWRADIGAPAEGTRRKALPRDDWMPQPQLAEKREAKRARGWVWPEDAVGRKELGKRGVRYGGPC